MKKDKLKKSIAVRFAIVLLIIFYIYIIWQNTNTGTLIKYVENDPAGEQLWNTMVTTSFEILNNGTVITYGSEEKLSLPELIKVKRLVRKLKLKVSGAQETTNSHDYFTIDGKKYSYGILDDEGSEILQQIEDMYDNLIEK